MKQFLINGAITMIICMTAILSDMHLLDGQYIFSALVMGYSVMGLLNKRN